MRDGIRRTRRESMLNLTLVFRHEQPECGLNARQISEFLPFELPEKRWRWLEIVTVRLKITLEFFVIPYASELWFSDV